MTRKMALVLALGLSLVVVAACQQQDLTPSSAMGRPASGAPTTQVNSNAMRPPQNSDTPVRIGLNGDPANPSGAPGPGDGTGTSSIH